jgi:hypothetical protein
MLLTAYSKDAYRTQQETETLAGFLSNSLGLYFIRRASDHDISPRNHEDWQDWQECQEQECQLCRIKYQAYGTSKNYIFLPTFPTDLRYYSYDTTFEVMMRRTRLLFLEPFWYLFAFLIKSLLFAVFMQLKIMPEYIIMCLRGNH